jgi:hypothetical protein
MQAIEFEATIENGIVQIPKQYKALQQNIKATFVVMYESINPKTTQISVNDELDELFSHSDNTTKVTMNHATQIEGMIDDGIL